MSDVVAAYGEAHPLTTLADAEHALKVIAVAGAAETLWARAKDATKLYEAIEAKLTHQAAYAVWRQDVLSPGGDRKSKLQTRNFDLPAADPGAVVIHRWRKRLCRWLEGLDRWVADDASMAATLADARQMCVRICEQENLGTIRGTEGTGEFERYTPAYYIEKAREVMGEIDLDPASCEVAQRTVRAARYFTTEDDGLQREWHGRVWLNPPYHRELAPQFIEKLIAEIAAGRIPAAIMLTNNSTDTAWFRAAAASCRAICFTTGRIHFEVPDREPVLPTQGQAFFYFGDEVSVFADVFDAVGFCVGSLM